jgi:hypothetical protein
VSIEGVQEFKAVSGDTRQIHSSAAWDGGCRHGLADEDGDTHERTGSFAVGHGGGTLGQKTAVSFVRYRRCRKHGQMRWGKSRIRREPHQEDVEHDGDTGGGWRRPETRISAGGRR